MKTLIEPPAPVKPISVRWEPQDQAMLVRLNDLTGLPVRLNDLTGLPQADIVRRLVRIGLDTIAAGEAKLQDFEKPLGVDPAELTHQDGVSVRAHLSHELFARLEGLSRKSGVSASSLVALAASNAYGPDFISKVPAPCVIVLAADAVGPLAWQAAALNTSIDELVKGHMDDFANQFENICELWGWRFTVELPEDRAPLTADEFRLCLPAEERAKFDAARIAEEAFIMEHGDVIPAGAEVTWDDWWLNDGFWEHIGGDIRFANLDDGNLVPAEDVGTYRRPRRPRVLGVRPILGAEPPAHEVLIARECGEEARAA